jgi:DNA-directed RNA polymerase specialized sigma24 family protein
LPVQGGNQITVGFMQEYNEKKELLEIDWMLQNSQVDDDSLAESLVGAYAVTLLHMASVLLDDLDLARDSAAEAIVRVIKDRHRFNGEQRLFVWLLALAYHYAQEKAGKARSDKFFRALGKQGASQDVSFSESSVLSLPSVRRIPAPNKTILLLRYTYQLSLREISHIVQLSVREVHERLKNSRIILQQDTVIQQKLQSTSFPVDYGAQVSSLNAQDEEADEQHSAARSACQAAVDEVLEYETASRIDAHLLACQSCKNFADMLELLNKWLLRNIQEVWPSPQFMETDFQHLLRNVKQKRIERRSLSSHFREVALGLSVIALMLSLAWFGRVVQAEPQATVIVLATHIVRENELSWHTPVPQEQNVLPPTGHDPQELPLRILLDVEGDFKSLPSPRHILPVDPSGPLSLAVVSSYWGVALNPDKMMERFHINSPYRDIFPQDLIDYLDNKPGLNAVLLSQGTIGQLKYLLAQGYPVILQIGRDGDNEDGNPFETLYGYDDVYRVLWLMASTFDETESSFVPYLEFYERWGLFDYSFLLVYPELREAELLDLIGLRPGDLERFQSAR